MIKKWVLLNNKRHVLACNNRNEIFIWDIIQCVIIKSLKMDFDEALRIENTPEWVSNWVQIDTKTG